MIVARVKISGASAMTVWANPITSGMVGAQVRIDYEGQEWDCLTKTVVFSGAAVVSHSTDDTIVDIPQECLVRPGVLLKVGVFGFRAADKKVVIPTVETSIGRVLRGADPSGDEAMNPELPEWAEILEKANTAEKIAQDLRKDAEDGRFNGRPGANGHTPEKGVDYFTPAEVAEIEAGAAAKLEPELSNVKSDLAAEVKRAKEAEDNRIKKFYINNLGASSVADSDDGAVRNLVIWGKSEQLHTNGYQLLNWKKDAITSNGVSYDPVGDGSVYVHGTSNATSTFELMLTKLEANTYTSQSGCPDVLLAVRITNADGTYMYYGNGTFTLDDDYDVRIYLQINNGKTVDTVISPMLSIGDTPHDWEPYTGGAPSPSPEYPQEIKYVENCSMIVSNADGTETKTAPIPVTLRGIGDVRDELYVFPDGTGKLVQRVGAYTITGMENWKKHSNETGYFVLIDIGQKKTNEYGGIFSHFQTGSIRGINKAFIKGDSIQIRIDSASTVDELKTWLAEHQVNVIYELDAPIETTITAEQVNALFDLRTYYGGTNVSYESENGVEPVVNFDYACALENFVEYIKAAQGDDRKIIYNMDERMTDAEYVAAMAYVNSEYASALAELMEV